MSALTFTDWVRVGNSVLALVTVWAMVVCTWRLAPKLKWWALVAREGVIVFTFAAVYGGVESVAQHAPYGVRVWIVSVGLLLSSVGYTVWAAHIPPRPLRRASRSDVDIPDE